MLALTHRFVGDRSQVGPELDDLLARLRTNPAASASDLVEALESHATWAMDQARWDQAEASSKEMIEVARSRLGERHHLTLSAKWSLVQSYLLGGKDLEAAKLADQVFPLMVEAHRDEPKSPELIEARELYGRVLTGVGRLDEGITHMAGALSDAADVFGANSILIAYYASNLAARQLEVRDLGPALVTIDKGIEVSAVVPGPASGLHAFAHQVRGQILLAARRGEAALAQLDVALEKLASSGERSNQSIAGAKAERALALTYTGRASQALSELQALSQPNPPFRMLGIVQRLAGDYVAALASQQKALEAITPGPRADRTRSLVLTEIGLNQLELGRYDAAVTSLTEALSLSRTLQRRAAPEHADILVGLGRAKLAQQLAADARALLEEADAFWRTFDPESRWAGESALWLGRGDAALGRVAEAEASLSRARAILSRSSIQTDANLVRLARLRP